MWRIYEKRGTKTKQEPRTKSRLAADMIAVLATWVVDRKIMVVADSAYIGKHLLKDRPAQVELPALAVFLAFGQRRRV